MLCPITTTALPSIRGLSPAPAINQSSAASASSMQLANENAPGLPHEPR